jgi:hypothetical protein
MDYRAASSFLPADHDKHPFTGVRTLSIHALDHDDLPLCREVKREDLTDLLDRPWSEWSVGLKCGACLRAAESA